MVSENVQTYEVWILVMWDWMTTTIVLTTSSGRAALKYGLSVLA